MPEHASKYDCKYINNILFVYFKLKAKVPFTVQKL